jgi:hypothetical protein
MMGGGVCDASNSSFLPPVTPVSGGEDVAVGLEDASEVGELGIDGVASFARQAGLRAKRNRKRCGCSCESHDRTDVVASLRKFSISRCGHAVLLFLIVCGSPQRGEPALKGPARTFRNL